FSEKTERKDILDVPVSLTYWHQYFLLFCFTKVFFSSMTPIIDGRGLAVSVQIIPSLFVSISFWILYTYNRELVYPKSLDGVIPSWLNHTMHTAVLPLALLEILATPHRYPAKKKGLFLLGCASFLYVSWVLWIYFVTGEWVYPLFASFSPAGLGAFFISSLAIIVCFYNFGEFLNRMIWGQSNIFFLFYFYPYEKKKKKNSYNHQGK
uniref:Androgen-dependent TFPI-regulating protein n=1 Tax=Pavo cristatus TaxID=9049 RepID=A0A8C9FMZ5_PAVCR